MATQSEPIPTTKQHSTTQSEPIKYIINIKNSTEKKRSPSNRLPKKSNLFQ
ncbi:hypothetical protein FC27_GL002120 [Companilactobacillus versmoldensis DSM 14857 = KCTC 3814]|uniref:Uncharacterized protein n=1 Tax=Companilactobacillus versmoldensis DSM 14857 = KCTC 3814 TaxID=1423815 RepID=A0A0R1SCV1_9LACO|nr:hypothetical protein FC27_GL002120 [Companilactobacillus versmoldensis DSM 14857 = KCTC 3814]